MSDEPGGLGDYVEFPDKQGDDDRCWLVLFPDDYDNLIQDVQGNVGLLVDQDQAGEVLRMASEAIAYQSHRDADGNDVIQDMVNALEKQIEDNE